MSVWDTSSHQAITEAELLEGQNLDEALMTKIGSNQEYTDAQRLLTGNAWVRGDDYYDHFTQKPAPDDHTAQDHDDLEKPIYKFMRRAVYDESAGAAITHDADNHLVTLGNGHRLWYPVPRRADRVESSVEVIAKLSASTSSAPYIGLGTMTTYPSVSAPGVDFVGFVKGTNTNTWKALTRSTSTTREETDPIAGNYIGWDTLRIDYYTTGAKFYVNGVLEATHTLSLPDTILMGLAIWNAGTPTLSIDMISFTALSNPVSP